MIIHIPWRKEETGWIVSQQTTSEWTNALSADVVLDRQAGGTFKQLLSRHSADLAASALEGAGGRCQLVIQLRVQPERQ